MSSIDERIVEMRFNNSQFEKGIKQTTNSLDDLAKALKLDGLGDGLEKIGQKVDSFNLDGINDNVEKMADKFNWFTPIAITAIAKVTDWALSEGKKIADFVWQPLYEGGKNRALNLQQARFQFENLGLDVKAMMEAVNASVDGTAYSLDQAAIAASNFAASQVPLEKMQGVLTAVAGTAAMSGAEYNRVADIFTKVAGQGRLMGDDLNRFGAIGINMAAELAKQWGVTEAEVRDLASKGQVSFQMLADAAEQAFGSSAFKSNELYTGSLANLRSAISRIGASYFDGIDPMNGFTGILVQQRDIFNAIRPRVNDLHNALKPLIQLLIDMAQVRTDSIVNFFNNLDLTDFSGGMKGFADGLRNIFNFLNQIKGAFMDAFGMVFKPSNAQILTKLGEGFANLTSKLTLSDKAVNMLKTAFTAILSVFKFVWETLVDVGKVLWALMQIAGEVFSFIFEVIGEVIKAFTGIEEGTGDGTEGVLSFFETLTELREKGIQPLLEWLEKARQKLSDFLDNIDVAGKVGKIVQWFKDIGQSVSDHIGPLDQYGENFLTFWQGVWNVLQTIWEWIAPILTDFSGWASDMLGKLGEFLSGLTMDDVLAVLNSAALVGFLVLLGKVVLLFKDIAGIAKSAKGVLDSISGAFNELRSVLKTFQMSLKVDMFLKVAIAIALLAGALILLSMQDQGKLWSAVGVVAAISAVLLLILYLLDKIVDEKNIATLQAGAWALVTLSGALLLMAFAIEKLGSMDLGDLAKGLGAVAIAMGLLLLPLRILSQSYGQMAKASASIMLIALGLGLLAGSVWLFAQMDWDTLIRGLTGAGLALGAVTVALNILSKDGGKSAVAAVGMMAVAAALAAIAGTVYLFGTMDLDVLKQGAIAAGVALGALVTAGIIMSKLGPNAMTAGAGVLLLAGAVGIIAVAVALLGTLEPDRLIYSTLAISAIIAVLVLAVNSVSKALPAVGGLLILAGAIVMIAGAVWIVAQLDPGAILMATLAIAALVAVLVLAINALGNAPQAMLGALALSAVLLALGLMFTMIGAAALMIVMALWLLGPAGQSAAVGIQALADVSEKVVNSFGPMLLMALAITAIGIAALIAAIGVGALALAFILLGVGLGIIALTGVSGALALQFLVNRLAEMMEHIGSIFAMAAALGVLGLAFIIFGAGALLAGAGLVLLGAGFALISAVGKKGAKVLEQVVEQIAGLTKHAVAIGVMSLALGSLGLAILPLGAGMLMAGTGAILFATGLTLIMTAISNPTFITNLEKMIELIPVFLENVANGIIAFSNIIAANAQTIADAMLLPVNAFLEGLQTTIPLAGIVIGLLIDEFFVQLNASTQGFIDWGVNTILALSAAIVAVAPQLTDDFMVLITNILNAMTARMPELSTAGGDFIIAIIRGIGTQMWRIITAAGETLLNFINGLTAWIRINTGRFVSAGSQLFRAVVDGISTAIERGGSDIRYAGARIGNALLQGAKNALGINSPAKEFIKIMGSVFEGVEDGDKKFGHRAEAVGEGIGDNLVNSMKDSIKNISSILDQDMDMSPTIRPVLDLSDVKRNAAQIDGLIAPSGLTPTRSLSEASSLESYYRAQRKDTPDSVVTNEDSNVTNYNYTQNITSPKAVSASEIYRNTNNQLSRKKEELTNA